MNEIKLQLLADKLKTVPQKEFDMTRFRSDGKRNALFLSPTDCGTAGCALGHAPLTKGLEPIEDDFYGGQGGSDLNFMKYSLRVFGLSDKQWAYCFSSAWEVVDNTPKGAAERIEFIIKNKEPPFDIG